LFPALILSIDRNPAAFSTLSKADPQPKSDGLLALVQRNRSWHDNATASEKVCLDEDMVRVGLDVGTEGALTKSLMRSLEKARGLQTFVRKLSKGLSPREKKLSECLRRWPINLPLPSLLPLLLPLLLEERDL